MIYDRRTKLTIGPFLRDKKDAAYIVHGLHKTKTNLFTQEVSHPRKDAAQIRTARNPSPE